MRPWLPLALVSAGIALPGAQVWALTPIQNSFLEEAIEGSRNQEGAQNNSVQTKLPKNKEYFTGVISIHKAIPSQSRRDLVLWPSEDIAGQLLGPSFYQMAGLGLMILGLSTSFCKALGLPSSDLTPFKVRAAILPMVWWVLSLLNWNCSPPILGWESLECCIRMAFG